MSAYFVEQLNEANVAETNVGGGKKSQIIKNVTFQTLLHLYSLTVFLRPGVSYCGKFSFENTFH